MAESHVVAALKDKRAEVSGLIVDLERRIAQHRADLVHLDAALVLFDPGIIPATIAAKTVRTRNGWFRPGELARMVLDILRVAPVPLGLKAIAGEVMVRRGLDRNDARTARLIGKLVNNALTRRTTETVEKIAEGRAVFWRIRA